MTPDILAEFEPVIGLEVHCQLRTASKAFCSCSTRFGDAPNTNTCPTCLGLPGALPVFNARALELALRLALATGCTLRPRSIFARKNYFYPDLPKGYQISQYEEPLAEHGRVEFLLASGQAKAVSLTRIHLEEDAGKSMHEASESTSFVDFNRSGVPLAEIVSGPDFRSPDEAHAYLVTIRQLVRYLGVSDGNMEQGSLRCDCNVSLRPRGESRLGTRVELKNLNSFRSVTRAIGSEIERQAELLRAGEPVVQGTRLWDEVHMVTRPMRTKEQAQDYRYFPDPDLPPLLVSEGLIAQARRDLPELPSAKRRRFIDELGLPEYDASVLTASRAVAEHFESVASLSGDARGASRWVLGEVLRELKERHADLEADDVAFPAAPAQVAELMALVAGGALSISAAKKAFAAMAWTDRGAAEVVKDQGLAQISDEAALRKAIRDVIGANPQALADFKAGQEKVFGFLVGQVMRATKGQAHPGLVNQILHDELEKP
jgi:aspartyl-tRNA(Asn)/glutamyl-tRNA(Gln) amidotransferase subunit B